MSRHNDYDDYEYDDDYIDDDELLDEEHDEDDNRETVAVFSGWGMSLALHAIVLLLLAFVVVAGRLLDDPVPVRTAYVEPPPPPPEEEKEERELTEVDITIEVEVEVETPVVTDLDVEVEEISTEDEEVSEVAEAKGREEAVSASETGGAGAFMAIGAGGGAAGAFGNRNGGGKKRALGRFGGTRASESAVDAALRWFKRHQSPNGMWDIDGYPVNCTLAGPKCEPGTKYTGADGDAAATGYAVLAFLGGGYDHRTPNKYRSTVKAGIDWLVANQAANGSFGKGRNYENGICGMALAEAYAMTQDPALREPAQRAIDYMLSLQGGDPNGYDGGAWNYVKNNGRDDSSVTGWVVMALKSAQAGNLDVGNGMTGSAAWFERTWTIANQQAGLNPRDPYSDVSVFPYVLKDNTTAQKITPGDLSSGKGARTAIGLCIGVFLGKGAGNIMMESMANEVIKTHLPSYSNFETMNQYWMYYNTLGIFQVGGDRWKQFNAVVRDTLVNAQRKSDDCFDGSWDYQLQGNNYHGRDVGRIISTAYCVLSLQVYYRYVPINNAK